MCPGYLDANSTPFAIPALLRNPEHVLCLWVRPGDCCGLLVLNELSAEDIENSACFYHWTSFPLPLGFTPITQVQAPTSNLPQFTDSETATDAEGRSSTIPYCVPIHTLVSEARQETQLEKNATFVWV